MAWGADAQRRNWLLLLAVKQPTLADYYFFVATCGLGTWSFQCDLWALTGTAGILGNSDVQPFFSPIPNDISFAQEGEVKL